MAEHEQRWAIWLDTLARRTDPAAVEAYQRGVEDTLARLTDRETVLAFVRAWEDAPSAPWDEDKRWDEQDYPEAVAGLRAVAAALAPSREDCTDG